jgi:hypothetical protein
LHLLTTNYLLAPYLLAIRVSLSPHSILISQDIVQYVGAKMRKHNEQSYKNDRFEIQM